MFVDTGRHHRGYIKRGEYTKIANQLSKLCKTCGYAWGDHSGPRCPGIETTHHHPTTDPEFWYGPNINTKIL